MPAPAAIRTYLGILANAELQPDFVELSPQAGQTLLPWRLTHYYNVANPATATAAWAVFVALAHALDIPMLPGLTAIASQLAHEPSVRQLCLGIAAEPAGVRLKCYWLFAGDAARPAQALCTAVLGHLPPGIPWPTTHIMGLDFTPAGLHDVKRYHQLDPTRVHRIFRPPPPPLLQAARRVVYQHSLCEPQRQSLHFQVHNPTDITSELTRLNSQIPTLPAFHRLLADLAQLGMLPAIVAYRHHAGQLDCSRVRVYVHERAKP